MANVQFCNLLRDPILSVQMKAAVSLCISIFLETCVFSAYPCVVKLHLLFPFLPASARSSIYHLVDHNRRIKLSSSNVFVRWC